MKKFAKILILLLALSLSSLLLFACQKAEEPAQPHVCPPHVDADGNNICDECGETIELPPADEAPDMSGVTFAGKTVVYNGETHSIEATGIPEGVLVSYENNNKKDAGTYNVVASFYYKGEELVDARLTATLEILKADISLEGISFPSKTYTYNGEEKKAEIVGELPDGVSLSYSIKNSAGDDVLKIVNADVYTVYATFRILRGAGNYHPIDPMVATVTVNKASVNMSGVSLPSATHTYDGGDKAPTVVGTLPEGVSVTYTLTNADGETVLEARNVGTYTVTAQFNLAGGNANYEEIPALTATVEIRPQDLLPGISFADGSFYYDGDEKSIFVVGVPDDVEVTYTGNNQTLPGSYEVVASFNTGDNYIPIEDMKATLEIKRYDLEGITFSPATFDYDGEAKSIFVVGAPDDVTVSYTGNGVSAPGTYIVTATIDVGNKYNRVEPLQATITINAPSADHTTAGLTFEKISGGYAVTGVEGKPEFIIIPQEYAGEPVISIKANAFRDNEKLTYVYIPDSVLTIAYNAFRDCSALSEVRFGSIKTIGQNAFANTALTEVVLPDSLTAIGLGAFEGTKLTSITLPFIGGSRTSSNAYLAYIFGGQSASAGAYYVPKTLTRVVLSDECTEIYADAFRGLTGLSEVRIGNNVKRIGNSAFYGCTSLRDIFIPISAIAIDAAAKPENSPFFGCNSELLIVVENISAASMWGRYYAALNKEGDVAIVVYNKTYEDYVMNKETYRTSDTADATLAGIFIGESLVAGFAPDIYEYSAEADINTGFGEISALAASSAANVVVSDIVDNKVTITVTSADGTATKTYTVSFTVTGVFESTSAVVNKGNAKGTVTFVVDDGYQPTATFMKSMMEKYNNLAVTYAVYAKRFLTTSESVRTDNGLIIDDIDGDGIDEYVLDADGNYTYVINEDAVEFWQDILSVGRSEIAAHSHTHQFWGVNDEGGAQLSASSAGKIAERIYTSLAEGSSAKEIYAAVQVIKDIFGNTSKSVTYITPGIASRESNTTVTAEVKVYLSGQTVRVLYDTPVTVKDGKVYLSDLTWVNLQSTVGTLPANTDVITPADVTTGVIPAGSAIYLASDYVTVPVIDADGNQNIVKGFKEYYRDTLYIEAYEEGVIIGARSTGQKIYVASDFTSTDTRLAQKAYMITTSSDDADITAWKNYIDSAINKNGGWASFCIHAMTPTSTTEGEGGHKITQAQAEELFRYASEKGDELWIATLTDATLYYHEWSSAKVTSSYDAIADKITVSLTDGERDDIYNMPLTIKVSVPATWQTAKVGDVVLVVERNERGGAYVCVDVAPETTVEITE